ncbi:MAG: pilus assembly protein PilM [Ruminococcus sp.]|nr:pilus assembly protein PilM [Ruminococcus sp.]
MLSFDITDRNIRVIKGTESGGGKIRIHSSTDIKIDEGLIVNGYVKDIAQLATVINTGLKQKGIKDKEAVVSISSNLIVFRELRIPKAKASQFKTAVQMEMSKNIAVNDEQAIAYTVVGDVEEDGKTMSKVLANAVPKNVVECFRRVFSMLNISLKSVSVSCNCISRVVLSDPQIVSRMPLLLVQIDPNFININVFENGQLSFSRFASISPDDYDDKSDYVFQAVNENLFRMFQFTRSRSGENVQNVVFYGDTSEFIRLTNSLEQMDVKASLLKVPPHLSGYENLEFSLYANAIGAMYKRPKEEETSNLLTVDTSSPTATNEKVDMTPAQIAGQMLVSALLGALVVGGVWGAFKGLEAINNNQIKDIDAYIASKQPEIDEIDRKQGIVDKLSLFNARVGGAQTAVASWPKIDNEFFEIIVDVVEKLPVSNVKMGYKEGEIEITGTTKDINAPAAFAQELVALDKFDNITYEGWGDGETDGEDPVPGGTGEYTVIDPETGEEVVIEGVQAEKPASFTITFNLRGNLQNEAIKGGAQ